MDIFTQFSDAHPFGTNSASIQETTSLSDASSSRQAVHSDEEVLLATRCPKKRAGRRVFRETRHPVFRGVRKRNGNKWVCEVREPNKKSRIWLGTYPTLEMAARAHDVAALALRGKSACLNFADSAWRLPTPVSKDASDIRRAANEAAELFRPQRFGGHEVRQNSSSAVVGDSTEVCSDDCNASRENVLYMDEEAVFDMPRLLVDMAEGLLLSPPHDIKDVIDWDDMGSDSDFSLWSY